MTIKIPRLSLILLMGASGAGKTTFARKHFLSTEIVSSDTCRGFVADNPNDQSASGDAFEVLELIVEKRLARGLLTVVDATNVASKGRAPFVRIARKYHCFPIVIALNMSERVCLDRNALRADRNFGVHVVRRHRTELRSSLRKLKEEGFRQVEVLNTPEEVEAATIERVPLWNDRRSETGPFDIIGDVHGCATELEELLSSLGYVAEAVEPEGPLWSDRLYRHPQGRKAVFVGDLVDRGPRVLDVVRIVRNMVIHHTGHCVPGNHDMKLLRKLDGKDVRVAHGLATSIAEIEALPAEHRTQFCLVLANFLDGLVSHYVFDHDKLVVAHAGLKESMHGRSSGAVREFCLYGETTGETDEYGLPVRHPWANEYRGKAMVVYGHTTVPEPEWVNNTVDIDTGCVFGGKLTALRYPEREFVSVNAKQVWCEPARPLIPVTLSSPQLTAQQVADDLLDVSDIIGRRLVNTRLCQNIMIREENAAAALEVMSRFAIDPHWLIYLPPTMSPSDTSCEPGRLEHPVDAFAYFRNQGVAQVVCEEKHMGSRAVVIVCRDTGVAQRRFGIVMESRGVVYTRTGRSFFTDSNLETQFLDRIANAITGAGLWTELETDWMCLDCELMPWSAKAQELLRQQYAATGAAGRQSLARANDLLAQAAARLQGQELDSILALQRKTVQREQNMSAFIAAYRHYCWPVSSLADYRLAPFHLLATEGHVHIDRDHPWHLQTLGRICREDSELLMETPALVIDVNDSTSERSGIEWWESLTQRGGEGMVVKPTSFIARGPQGLIQPAVKCRGPEYLRIIYGPDYALEENLERLRNRGVRAKRTLATREFALGIEGLERFVRHEPLRRTHECAFGVLALESEPVDPRL